VTHGQPLPGHRPAAGFSALLTLGYAAAAYLVFLAVLAYSLGFFADLGVPRGIDEGTRTGWPAAVATDTALLLLFAVQHTGMARARFKRQWTRLVPAPAERAMYVLFASLLLALLYWLWQPVGGTVWRLPEPGRGVLLAVYAAGWVIALSSTFLISHFDLFGVRQAYLHARG